IFGRLPGLGVARYLNEADFLGLSVGVAPMLAAAASLFLAWLPGYLAGRPAARETGARSYIFIIPLALASGAVAALFQWNVVQLPHAWDRGGRDPILWFASSAQLRADDTPGEAAFAQALSRFTRELGPGIPFRGLDTAPLCRAKDDGLSAVGDGEPPGNRRNVIVVVLESVSMKVLRSGRGDKALMPRLSSELARSGLTPGLISAGTKSSQALHTYLTGIPPHPSSNLIWYPNLRIQAWPGRLVNAGYRTAYFHGGDLVFENQRQLLRTSGFQELVELDYEIDHPVSGWGWDDEYMRNRLTAWIAEQGETQRPYLAMWSTLSTHHPYAVPDTWVDELAPAEVEGMRPSAVRAFRYLDDQIGELIDWYRREEAPRGTILVITADHPPVDAPAEDEPWLPLMLFGLDAEEEQRLRQAQGRILGAQDLSATVSALLDLEPGPCNLGMDALSPPGRWNDERWVYSAFGSDIDVLRLFHRDGDLTLDRGRRKTLMRWRQGGEALRTGRERALALAQAIRTVHNRLFQNNAYAPEAGSAGDAGPSAADMTDTGPLPIIVSHRGNHAPGGRGLGENSISAIAGARASGFDWVEIDVRVTGDGVPVLHHDREIRLGDMTVNIDEVPLEVLRRHYDADVLPELEVALRRFGGKDDDGLGFLVELKSHVYGVETQKFARTVGHLISELGMGRRVIVDSFDPTLAMSAGQFCDCAIAFDTPFRKTVHPAQMPTYRGLGGRWLYVHHSVIDAAVVQQAHDQGLKVMAYTINELGTFDAMGVTPDGVITDSAELAAALRARRALRARP
ncbi:MAG: sulfatase-like hydrolase/transferase, partial [Gammaproteobacteria bacterium]